MEFLRTSGINHKLDEIIINAKEHLLILSPYVKINNIVFQRLSEKMHEQIRIDFVYGKDEKSAGVKKLEKLTNLSLYFNANLHAKLYCNENEMLLTSLNLYDFSQINNREMGIYLTKDSNPKLFNDALKEAKSIIQSSEKIQKGQISKLKIERIVLEDRVLSDYEYKKLSNFLDIRLKKEFPNENCEIRNGDIYFSRFFNKDININVLPKQDSLRISFELKHKWEMRKELYKKLSTNLRQEIESAFPREAVNWGGQMNRIKIDLFKDKHPEYFKSNEESVEGVVKLFKIGITSIVNCI